MGLKNPPVQLIPEALPEVRRPGLEFNVSLSSSCEIKNEWNYTSSLKPTLHYPARYYRYAAFCNNHA